MTEPAPEGWLPRCSKCGERKPKSEFYSDKHRSTGVTSYCKSCMRVHVRGHASQRRRQARVSGGAVMFRFTEADYVALFERQNGTCAICRHAPPPGKSFSVDHDHRSGHVRGLLCSTCNTGLGFLRDSAELLGAARHYLANPPAYRNPPLSGKPK